MKKLIKVTKAFKKDFKRIQKQNKNIQLIKDIILNLECGKEIPTKYSPHKLKGNWKNHFECHIETDWLMIWKEDEDIIYLIRTGSHAELFQQ